jgi:hypothetical protein
MNAQSSVGFKHKGWQARGLPLGNRFKLGSLLAAGDGRTR